MFLAEPLHGVGTLHGFCLLCGSVLADVCVELSEPLEIITENMFYYLELRGEMKTKKNRYQTRGI